jgi:hypothetical protein
MPLYAENSGIITFVKAEGSMLEPGTVIATLQLDNPGKETKSTRITKFIDSL